MATKLKQTPQLDCSNEVDPSKDYISILKEYMDKLKVLDDVTRYTKIYDNRILWQCTRTIKIDWSIDQRTYTATHIDISKKSALNVVCCLILSQMPPRTQMERENPVGTKNPDIDVSDDDSLLGDEQRDDTTDDVSADQEIVATEETAGGVMNQISTKAANTIITTDKTRAANSPRKQDHSRLIKISSSEPTHQFPSIQNRWTPLASYKLSAGTDFSEELYPIDKLISGVPCSISTTPFESFAFSHISVQILFKVNANKFQSGKYVACVVNDPALIEFDNNGFQINGYNYFNTQHVIIDINSCQDTILSVPFIYPRTFNRPVEVASGNPGYLFGHALKIHIASIIPLTVGAGGVQDVELTLFMKLTDVCFAGMVPRITNLGRFGLGCSLHAFNRLPQTQMNYEKMIKSLDSQFSSLGFAPRMDKPTTVKSTVIVPRASYLLSVPRGYSHADKLYHDAGKQTTYLPDHNDENPPTSFKEFARVWGYQDTFSLTPDMSANTVLYECDLDPARIPIHGKTDYKVRNMIPIQFAANCFQFWSGTQEIRLDFASTNFHTATLSVTFEYGRPQPDDACGGFSSYNKTFHLSEQKSFHFTVPYIYETPYRRTQTIQYFGEINYATSGATPGIPRSRTAVYQSAYAKMVIRVVNPLRPIQNVNSKVECVIMRRAGPSFDLKYPIAPNGFVNWNNGTVSDNLDNFPLNYNTPSTQMDTGDKEDLDPTKDFSPGVSGRSVQITGDHTYFYDLIRKPTLFLESQWVGTDSQTSGTLNFNNAYFIPVQPLCPGFAGTNSAVGTSGRTISISTRHSHQYAICSLFRQWRGSLRYTFVFRGDNENPVVAGVGTTVYIYHLPHAGSRALGLVYLNSPDGYNEETDVQDLSIGNHGYPVTIVDTRVNPVASIEVPYSSENNWTRTYNLDPNRNELYGEKGMFNTGHIVLQTPKGFKTRFDCFIECGADFKLRGFNPIFDVRYPALPDGLVITDARGRLPETQMFSGFKNAIGDVTSNVSNWATKKNVFTVATTAVYPPLGMGIIAANANETISEARSQIIKASSVVENTSEVLTKLSHNSDQLSQIMDQILKIVTPFSQTFSDIYDYSAIVMDCIFEFIHVFVSPTAKTIAVCVVNILRKLGLISTNLVTRLISAASSIFKYLIKKSNNGNETPSTQLPSDGEDAEWNNAISSFCGLLIGAVSSIFAVKWSGDWSNCSRGLFKNMGMMWSISVNSARFLKDTLVFIKRFILQLLGKTNPVVNSLDFFQEKSEFIKKFVNDSQSFLLEVNASNYRTNPTWRVHGWTTMMNACIIQQQLCNLNNDSRAIAPSLSRLCTQVITRANTLSCDMTASPIRYEPFVIAIEGGTGIGKSFLTTDLVVHLLKEVGYTSTSMDLMFVKNPGPEFWNGIDNQPVIIYDDWMASSDPEVETTQLMELLSLKSTAVFNPNIAQLELKNKKINPQIIILLCNNAFPQVSQTMRTPGAILRRRDMVWQVQKKSQYLNMDTSEIPIEVLDKFEHLEFAQYKSNSERSRGCVVFEDGTPRGKSAAKTCINYEQFKATVAAAHTRYNVREKRNVRKRLERLQDLLPANAPRFNYDQDPFSLFYATQLQIAEDPTLHQNAALPSEVIAANIETFLRNLEQATAPNTQFGLQDVCEWFKNVGYALANMYHCTDDLSFTGLLLDKLKGLYYYLMGPLEDSPSRYRCITNGEQLHGVCESCYDQLPNSNCPMCRTPGLYPIVEYNGIRAILKKCMKALKQNRLTNFVGELILGAGYLPTTILDLYILVRTFNCAFSALDVDRFLFPWGYDFTDPSHMIVKMGFTYLKFIACMNCATYTYDMARRFLGLTTMVPENLTPAQERYGYTQMDPNDVNNVPSASYVPPLVVQDPQGQLIPTNHASYTVLPSGALLANESVDEEPEQFSEASQEDFLDQYIIWEDLEHELPAVWREIITAGVEEPRCFINDATHPNNIRLHMVDWSKINLNIVPQTPAGYRSAPPIPNICAHEVLFEHLDQVRYHNGKWHLAGNMHYGPGVDIENHPCTGENCLFDQHRNLFLALFSVSQGSGPARTIIDSGAFTSEQLLQDERIPPWMIPIDDHITLVTQALSEVNMIVDNHDSLLSRALSKVCDVVSRSYKYILGALAAFGALYGLYVGAKSMYTFFFSSGNEATPTIQATYDPGVRPRFFSRPGLTMNSILARPSGVGQMDTTNDLPNVVLEKLLRNSGFIEVRKQDGSAGPKMRFQGIRGKYALMPRHYVAYIKTHPEYSYFLVPVHTPTMFRPYTYSELDFILTESTDAALFKLPIHYPPFKDIVKFIPTIDNWKTIAIPNELSILESNIKSMSLIHRIQNKGVRHNVTISDPNLGLIVLSSTLTYNLSKNGLCGSPIVMEKGNKPFVGIHVAGVEAGYTGTGFSLLLVAEDFDWIPKTEQMTPPIKDEEMAKVMPTPETQIEYFGRTSQNKSNFINDKTKIVPSLIQHEFPDLLTKEPAILSARDKRYIHEISPLVAGISKHGKLTGHINTKYIYQVSSYMNEHLQKCKPLRPNIGVLNTKQAIVGFSNLEFYTPLVLTTSAGYPWTLDGLTTKERYIKYIRNEQEQPIDCEISEEILESLKVRRDLRSQGIIPPTIFCDSLKDELKSKQDVGKLGKTRVFCASPVDASIEHRQYYQDFIAAFMKNRHDLFHGVGMSPDGPEWTTFISNLLKKSNRFVCFDYSNFGPGFNAQVGEVAMDAISNWYSTFGSYNQDEEETRNLLKYELLNSVHIAHDCIYQQFGGSPSGAIITTVLNSLVNMGYIFLAWIIYNEEINRETSYEDFVENNCLYVYGDDVIFTTKFQTFNGKRIKKIFDTFGIQITSSIDKNNEIEEFVPLKHATFLKRSFKPHPIRAGTFLAPIDMTSVNNCALWVLKTPDMKFATNENAKQALQLAYSHGPEIYDKFRTRLNNALIANDIDPITTTWQDLDMTFFK
ncbi:polyprotein [Oryctes rhinoceros picorna-like virus 1]|nr:polyprotein [Oryctes rhinoceros picorna-like virus 1]